MTLESVYIFLGPTLPLEQAKAVLDAVYLPPVSQGDILRLCVFHQPSAIGIIDGYFERVPAVWHKEILWAMKRGVHVLGCASMGALRAAELQAFGMEGIGKIYEDFQNEVLSDDDEVAIAHAAPEDGYLALSTAMVDMRATFRYAKDMGVISSELCQLLEETAKALHYPERIYPTVVALAKEKTSTEREIEAFEAWLPSHKVHQKAEDALQMLGYMRERFSQSIAPKETIYTFQYVQLWDFALKDVVQVSKSASDNY